MVSPTLRDRISALDVLRGAAILGILIANIAAFSGPVASAMVSQVPIERSGADGWVQTLINVFVTGKFRSMLSVLFGIGLWLQFRKRSAVAGNWPGGYLKRMVILALFGVLHGVLIWWGDILFIYSLVGVAGCLLVKASPRAVKVLCAVLLGLGATLGALLTALTASGVMAELGRDPGIFTDVNEVRIHAAGGWVEQFQFRATMFALSGGSVVFVALVLLPLFLIGIQLGREGVLAAPSRHPATIRRMLIVGLGIGLPFNMLAIPATLAGFGEAWEMAAEMVGGPLLAFGYLALGAIWVERGAAKGLRRYLEVVGRTALSCYILQSLVCTAIFYSWGLGLFGRLDLWQAALVVPAVWVVDTAFALWWLRRYDIGPVEWAWRSLTEGRLQPWHREQLVVAGGPAFDP